MSKGAGAWARSMPIIWQIYVVDEFAVPEEAGRFQSNESDIG